MRNLIYALISSCFILSSCVKYSPYEVIIEEDERDLNFKNLFKISQQNQKSDTIVFAFIGDTQLFYEESLEFVDVVNQRNDVDFVVISGDLTEHGLNDEFRGIAEIFNRLDVPYLTVVGNHDLVYNGQKIYELMFGPLNYSFTYKRMRFIMLNTNGREFEFNGTVPDIPWLNQQLSDTANYENALVISHIAPDNDDFDQSLSRPYTTVLGKWGKTLLSMNGHVHDFGISHPYNDGVTYFNSYSIGKDNYSILTVWPGGFSYENFEL